MAQIRKFPRGERFTQNKKVDKLFAFLVMLSKSEYDFKKREMKPYAFVEKKDINYEEISREIGKGRTTIYRQMKKLESSGYIKETEDRVILTVDAPYQLISKETLSQLTNIGSDNLVNTYVYLVGRFNYFAKIQGNGVYLFSQKEIISQVFKASDGGSAHKKARDIIEALSMLGFIVLKENKKRLDKGYYYVMTSYNDKMTSVEGKIPNRKNVKTNS